MLAFPTDMFLPGIDDFSFFVWVSADCVNVFDTCSHADGDKYYPT